MVFNLPIVNKPAFAITIDMSKSWVWERMFLKKSGLVASGAEKSATITLVAASGEDILISSTTARIFDRVLETRHILNPSLASCRLYSAPMPSDAPVMSAQGLCEFSLAGYFLIKEYSRGSEC
jgi:hypothetical protein